MNHSHTSLGSYYNPKPLEPVGPMEPGFAPAKKLVSSVGSFEPTAISGTPDGLGSYCEPNPLMEVHPMEAGFQPLRKTGVGLSDYGSKVLPLAAFALAGIAAYCLLKKS